MNAIVLDMPDTSQGACAVCGEPSVSSKVCAACRQAMAELDHAGRRISDDTERALEDSRATRLRRRHR